MTHPNFYKYILYARKSTNVEDKQILSIDAQIENEYPLITEAALEKL
jgi:hypothetical protein